MDAEASEPRSWRERARGAAQGLWRLVRARTPWVTVPGWIVLFVALIIGSGALLNLYINPSTAGTPKDVVAARNGVVDLLTKIAGGGLLAIGAYFTARS